LGKSRTFFNPIFHSFRSPIYGSKHGILAIGKNRDGKSLHHSNLGGRCFTIGCGLFFTNKSRITQFETAYNRDVSAFVKSELVRAEATLKEYQTIVFKVIPLIIAVCAIGIVFIDKPIWRASLITTIAMMVVILLIDGTAHARIDAYNQQLLEVEKEGN